MHFRQPNYQGYIANIIPSFPELSDCFKFLRLKKTVIINLLPFPDWDSFEVTLFIHIQYKMPFSVLFLISLTLSCLPVSLSYLAGARSESCYNMLVMHTNFLGQVASSMECGDPCQYELRVVGRVNAENRSTPMETTYQFGETYHCK